MRGSELEVDELAARGTEETHEPGHDAEGRTLQAAGPAAVDPREKLPAADPRASLQGMEARAAEDLVETRVGLSRNRYPLVSRCDLTRCLMSFKLTAPLTSNCCRRGLAAGHVG